MSGHRRSMQRALATVGLPPARFANFMAAWREGRLEAVARLDRRVADALKVELDYGRLGVRLDPKARHRREAGRDD